MYTVKLKIKKELSSEQQKTIIKLKGSLISKGYTEIIHIDDKDEDFHINSFETEKENKNEVHDFIDKFIDQKQLADIVVVFK